VHHVSYGSGSYPLPGGLGYCHTYSGSLWPCASNIKKRLASLLMQLDPHVLNVRVHVFKAPDVRAIMDLHDVWADCIFNTY
jgi:hypothetical protein